MFAKTIIDSDAFLDMDLSTQALYFHLAMRADDEGFVNNPKRIMRTIGAIQNDYYVLLERNFIISFQSGIIVIKHWKMHNYIRKDRLKKTAYQEEKNMLETKDNGSYKLANNIGQSNVSQMSVKCQHRLGKDRLDKNRVGKDSINNNVKNDCTIETSKNDINTFFESVWKLYPNKKGKGQVSDTKKKKLYEFGYDTIAKCIERYKSELEKDKDWRKPQNGSTFFNSGYVDYLDENYIGVNKTIVKQKEEPVIYAPYDEKLNKAISDFIDYRKKINAPFVDDHAIDLLINELQGLSSDPDEQIKILERSIVNGWKGIFELNKGQANKSKGYSNGKQSVSNFIEDMKGWVESE